MLDFDGQESKDVKLKELVSTMENIVVENKVLDDKMLAIVREKKVNERKFVQIIKEIKDILRIQPEEMEKFDEHNAPPVAFYSVADIVRNVFIGWWVDDESLFDKIEDNEEKAKAQIMLDNTYMSKEELGITFDNNKDVSTKTIIDPGNLVKSCSSATNLRTRVIIEDTEHLDENKHELPMKGSLKTVKDNRLLIEPSDSFGDNINKDLTGYNMKDVETSTPLDLTGINGQVAGVFVFSDAKKSDYADTEEEIAEQSILSMMTFEQKKVYFAQKIKAEQESAMKGKNAPIIVDEVKSKSPAPLTNSLFRGSYPPSNVKRKSSEGEVSDQHQNDEIVCQKPDGDGQNVLEERTSLTPNVAQSVIPFVKIPAEEQVEESECRGGLLLSTDNTAVSSGQGQEERIRAL